MAYTAMTLTPEHREIFLAVLAERSRQNNLHPESTARELVLSGARYEALAVLVEEVGEVSKAIMEDSDPEVIRDEVIQVAAVALAILEGLDYYIT